MIRLASSRCAGMGHTALLATLLALVSWPAPGQAAALDDTVQWEGVYSDTTPNFVVYPRAPSMAFGDGDRLKLRVRTLRDDLSAVTCRVWLSGPDTEQYLPAEKLPPTPGSRYDTWSATLDIPESPHTTRVWYRFILEDGSDTAYLDAGADTDAWWARGVHDDPDRWQFDFMLLPGFDTPPWSRDAVFYQIFPDRFADGDPSNNFVYPDDCLPYLDYLPALPADDSNCVPYQPIGLPDDPKGSCMVHDDWSDPPAGNSCDFFGGDIQGITGKLDYLESLGVTALYLNPIFRSPTNHKYDTMDYDEVDPRFGGNEALMELVPNAHARAMRVVFDGVYNHVSEQGRFYNLWLNPDFDGESVSGIDPYPDTCGAWEQAYLLDYLGNPAGCESPYRDWFHIWIAPDGYNVDHDDDTQESVAHACGWWGLEFMPEIDYGIDPDSEPRVWLYGGASAADPQMAAESQAGKWLADGQMISEGLDGQRLDVPGDFGYFTDPAQDACESKVRGDMSVSVGIRTASKALGEDKYVSLEIWEDSRDWFEAYAGDGVMNYYYFGQPISCFLTGKGVHNDPGECTGDFGALSPGSPNSVSALDSHLATERRVYPAPAVFSSQNSLGTHDTARFASRAGAEGPVGAALFLQATLPGAPMIYYGDEVLVKGEDQDMGRAPFPWEVFDTADPDSPELATWRLTRQLMCLRRAYSPLRTGSFVTLAVDDGARSYGYGRFDTSGQVAAAINSDTLPHDVTLNVALLDIPDAASLVDVLSDASEEGNTYHVSEGTVTVSLEPYAGVVLVPTGTAEAGLACRHLAPVADAGEDQDIAPEDPVVLDGTNSYHPDYRPLTYTWLDDTGQVLGQDPVVVLGPLPTGTHSFTLEVADDLGYTDTDDVEVCVGCCATGAPASAVRGLALLLGIGLAPVWLRARKRLRRR